MPSFFSSLSSYFSSPQHSQSQSQSQSRSTLSTTHSAFSLPSHSSTRAGSPVYGHGHGHGQHGHGHGPGQGQGQGLGSRSASPAFGEYAEGLSRPDRVGLGRQPSPSNSRHNSYVGSSSASSGQGQGAGGQGVGSGFSYPPVAHGGRNEGGYEYSATGRVVSGTNRTTSPSGLARPRTQGEVGNFFSPNGPLIYYPPLKTTWTRIRKVLIDAVPELHDTLSGPVDSFTLADAEAQLGCVLPPSVRDSYACVDGQDPSSEFKEGLFFGLTFLTLEDSLREWSFWKSVEHDPYSGGNPDVLVMMSSIPSGWIRAQYACRGWLPLITDRCGNYVGVDLSPAEQGGAWGQVIVFGREFDRKCVLFRGEGEGGWGRWLAGFAEELESGEGWEIDGASHNRRGAEEGEDEEDEIGYQSYYYDGGGGSGGDSYGEAGGALRLTGEYKGWGVLEAWWDRSVRRWDELGMGLSQAEIRRQQEKIDKRRSARMSGSGGGAGNGLQGLGFGGMRIGTPGDDAQVAIPVLDDPRGLVPSIPAPQRLSMPQPPASPGPETSLLNPRSPSLSKDDMPETPITPRGPESSNFRDYSSDTPHAPTPRRLVTPYSPVTSPEHQVPGTSASHANAYPSTSDGFLSPPSGSPHGAARKRISAPAPAPLALDLPTRADVQAAHAVAMAEEQGLRGGWVMSMEAATKPTLADRRSSTLSSIPGVNAFRRSPANDDTEMVDIDLEGGKQERFGSPNIYASDVSPTTDKFPRAISPLAAAAHQQPPSLIADLARTPSPSFPRAEEQQTPRPRAQTSGFFDDQLVDENTPGRTIKTGPTPESPSKKTTDADEDETKGLGRDDVTKTMADLSVA